MYGPDATMFEHCVHSEPSAVIFCQAAASTSHSRTPGARMSSAAWWPASVIEVAIFRQVISSAVLISFASSRVG